ncbi:DUF2169 domain-containing protein [Curvibacter gracilis]|uniref:DUF2169 domain-containing protein n=1 Tax=Curvibacter gracilis TaxID=230310 RepID=UPI00048A16D8|nr:DUF2169 domain-containing protein [Curvibacter gracilis]
MTMELQNNTPFVADMMQMVDAQGREVQLVIVKATWLFDSQLPAPPAQAAPLYRRAQRCRLGDLALDPLQQRLLEAARKADDWVDWVGADYGLPKPALDVLVAGHCHAPGGRACRLFEAGLWIDEQQWLIHAHAPRCWRPATLLGWRIEPLGRVASVPMHAAFSFGGQMNPERGPQIFLAVKGPPEEQTRLSLLPWLEDPRAPIRTPKDRPTPAGWNHWPSDAPHRQRHVGACDEVWRQLRAPRPPQDFDPRFYNLAASALQLGTVPAPGTPVRLLNLSSRGLDTFAWPDLGFSLQVQSQSGLRPPAIDLVPDTLLIEPTLRRYSITWRTAVLQGVGPARLGQFHLSVRRAASRPPFAQSKR